MNGSQSARRRRRYQRRLNLCGCFYCAGNKRPFRGYDSRSTRERRAFAYEARA
jgi:hypothetical protein